MLTFRQSLQYTVDWYLAADLLERAQAHSSRRFILQETETGKRRFLVRSGRALACATKVLIIWLAALAIPANDPDHLFQAIASYESLWR